MAVYNLSPILDPQFIANGAAAQLTFSPPGAGTKVPAGYNYQIAVVRVANVSAAPVSLKLWRVPTGGAADDQHVVCPSINIPVATQTFPYFDLTCLWGAVLGQDACIYALAGSANALTIQGDGAVIQV